VELEAAVDSTLISSAAWPLVHLRLEICLKMATISGAVRSAEPLTPLDKATDAGCGRKATVLWDISDERMERRP
jgi:hypothetical protein